jgi:hypothetical protein
MTRTRRTLVLLAIAAVAAACASGCSPASPPSAPVPSATAAAADPAVDYRDPERVCRAFAAALHRADTTVDGGPDEAYRRATAYMDARLAAAVAAQPPVPQTPQWQQWAAHGVFLDVQVGPYAGDALPPATEGVQHHAAVVTAWPIGRDGWRGPAQRRTVVCTLRIGDAGWRVAGYETG